MALRDTLEIYIPREADVRSIPLCSLPNSILRRMGLPLSHSDGSRRGTWICPAVIRRKGQKVASDTGSDVKKEFLSLMGRESRAKSDPHRLSFVSSNRTAYDLLKSTNRGSAVSADTSHTFHECQDLPPETLQDAVLVYNGQIYLSLRNPNRHQSKKKVCDPKVVSQSFPLSTSDLRKVLPDNRAANKQITCKVNSENTTCVAQKGSDVSSSMDAHSVPDSTDRVDSQDVGAEQTDDDVADQESNQFEPPEEDVANGVSGECDMQEESLDHTGVMDFCMSPISTEKDDQVSSPSWTTGEPLQKEWDFNELERDEIISRMKARFKEKKDALSILSP